MQGASNDFIVIQALQQPCLLTPTDIQAMCHRTRGIGADQVLIIESSHMPGCDFKYRIFNADGGEVENCGNGARCFARYVYDRGLTDKKHVRVEIARGEITLHILNTDPHAYMVEVDMGEPSFQPESLPFLPEYAQARRDQRYCMGAYTFGIISMGNPHAVLCVDDKVDLKSAGEYLQIHAAFPQSVNVGLMQVINRHSIQLRVYERGSGETLACGTGACAAVAHGIALNLLDATVDVHMRGGQLQIYWPGPGHHLKMRGDAHFVFDGVYIINK